MKYHWAGLAAFVLAVSTPFAAEAATARIAWSTFLRAGAGYNYTALDELVHGASVQLNSCGPTWCRVRSGGTVGYIDKDALALSTPMSGAAAASGAADCFVSVQTGFRGGAPTRFCVPAPRAAAPAAR